MTRDEFIILLENTFDSFAIKTVSDTDINKAAYVPSTDQKSIFHSLNFDSRDRRQDIEIKEMFTNRILTISYYGTMRAGSGRSPEIRMGRRDLISYLSRGAEIVFATDGVSIFIYNLDHLPSLDMDIQVNEENILSQINIDFLRERALIINAIPVQVTREVTSYSRNTILREYVKKRSNYTCEISDCDYVGFEQTNGQKYIEVHHVTPLSEGGDDSIYNTVALCPSCHRKIHYAENKIELREQLHAYLENLNPLE